MRNGAACGSMRMSIGVPAGSFVPNSGTRAARTDEFTGRVVPPRAISVMSWLSSPHSVMADRSWLNADDEITRPSP